MNALLWLEDKLRFDREDDRFELLETEPGSPRKWSGWNETARGRKHGRSKPIPSSLRAAEKALKALFNADENPDAVFRHIKTPSGKKLLIVYMSGMADAESIAKCVIAPLLSAEDDGGGAPRFIMEEIITIPETDLESDVGRIREAITDGKTAVFTGKGRCAILIDTRGYEKRAVSEPQNERIVRGPKESFIEAIQTNVTLIRRQVRTSDLIVGYYPAGGANNTKLALIYRKGFTNESLVKEVKKRLESAASKFIISTGTIEQFIEDDRLFPLPQTLTTERPDRAAAALMQGAVVILSDGSPFALLLPITVSMLMSSPEDAYMRRPLGSIIRSVRYAGALISILLPGYFIALAMYHQGLLSTEVLSTVIKSREMVFEPLPFEMLLLLFVFQLIREAGMRVPGSVGQAIGVIGGLILGQAAVAANLASTVILIIVAISGLGNLCIPDYSTQIAASYFRFGFVLAAWMGGLLGMTSAMLLFIAYMANMKSFGVPFLAPFAPKTYSKRPFVFRGRLGRHMRAEDYLNTADDKRLGTE